MTNIFNRFDKTIIYPNGKEQGRYTCMSYEDEKKIKAFLKQELLEIMIKTIGKEDICRDEMFYNENGIDRANGKKFFSNGYNLKRDNLIQTYRELCGDKLVNEVLEKLNK